MNGITYGTPIAGSFLLRHGNAPRQNPADRNQMAWFECSRCGTFKAIRVQAVRLGITVSCGCKGRKEFIAHFEKRAANIAPAVQEAIFKLARHPNKKRRLGVYALAKKFKLSRYVIDFIIAAKCAVLRALEGAGDAALRGINWVERRWLGWTTKWNGMMKDTRKERADRAAFLAALPHWRDRDAYLAAEAARDRRISDAQMIAWLRELQMTEAARTAWRDEQADLDVVFVDGFVPVDYVEYMVAA
jgi:hypothetical protein